MTTPTTDRVRISVIADDLGIDFAGLFSQFCKVCPKVVDNDMTVPAAWLRVLRYARFEGKDDAVA